MQSFRFDAGSFIWQEALYDGYYVAVGRSAMGRCLDQEQIRSRLERYFGAHESISPYAPAFGLEIDGALLDGRWEYVGHTPAETTLRHSLAPVEVRIHTQTDGSEFLARWLTVINNGDRPMRLSRVYTMSGIIAERISDSWSDPKAMPGAGAGPDFELGAFRFAKPLREGEFYWQPMENNTIMFDIKSRVFAPPVFVVKNNLDGESTVVALEWSGNICVEFRKDRNPNGDWWVPPYEGYISFKAGSGAPAPQYVLKPGGQVQTPCVHISMCYGGTDDWVAKLHDHLRRSVTPRQPEGKRNLVEYNHTGYTRNAQITRELLTREVDMAAHVGAELFMLDAGWFGGADTPWYEAVGDWEESPLLGGALPEILGYARGKGLKIGLWVEIERAHEKSKLFRSRPDLFARRGGRATCLLDLANPEAFEYAYDEIIRLIEKYGLDCFRLDHNQSMQTGGEIVNGGCVEHTQWEYYEKLYALFDRVAARYPGLLLENCASGGGRVDYGIMKRFHYTQLSDNWSPNGSINILNGMTLALPPEQCMPIVGAINMAPADTPYIARAGMFGHMCISGVYPSVDECNEDGLAAWRHAVGVYKNQMRAILDTCRVYHHTPFQDYTRRGEWVVLEYAARDSSLIIAGFFRQSESAPAGFEFVPRGVDIEKDYEVTLDNFRKTARVSGYELSNSGMVIRLNGMMQSELVIMRSVCGLPARRAV